MPKHVTARMSRAWVRSGRSVAVALAVAGLGVSLVGCAGDAAPPSAPAANSDVGKAFASEDGVAVSVTRRICGISGVGEDKPEFTAVGQYCTVGVNVENGTDETIDLAQLKVKGLASDVEYFPDYWAGTAADGGMQALDAGESVESTLFFDMPKDQLLERVELTSPWSGIESFEVSF
ncbi:DUF4352 domain-containing protein [Salinibacterium sp. dk2585]|uniref:DUF4352 domain-containing protein n=1 Tax=unclassified Salinibacterium TaxID=2632331 RepID=UPI0011C2571A|nr:MULTISPECIES: DUF4352 domain-containing protein [unclassified Salinibacterium]QEE62148.1 DUF4352 domain-containing protein [Salinibacterium sp. dk2585]TXK53500.1 DUF4352 domain-containing protein [Salinibacterium sp. dk5596]